MSTALAAPHPPTWTPTSHQIADLRSRDPERVLKVLRAHDGVPASLVPHLIPLLAWDAVAQQAMIALRKVAEERIGELTDALVNPNQPFVVRRRLARVFSVCTSQRAADGLLLGLDDLRFEVRYHCARSLTELLEKNPRIRIDRERIFDVVQREAAVGRPVWDSQRLLHQVDDLRPNLFDDVVKDRASRSLAHVFTLLALVLPAEPLLIAFRGLQTDNQHLRGTALEYLEGVLPPPIRASLWPYLEDPRTAPAKTRPREQILDDLLRSHQSILLNLEELKERAKAADAVGSLRAPDHLTMTEQKRIIAPRQPTPSSRARDTGRLTNRLPDDVLAEQVQRFALFTAVGGGLWTMGLLVDTVLLPADERAEGPPVRPRHRSGGHRLLGLHVSVRALLQADAAGKDRPRSRVHAGQRGRRSPLLNTWVTVPTQETLGHLSWVTDRHPRSPR